MPPIPTPQPIAKGPANQLSLQYRKTGEFDTRTYLQEDVASPLTDSISSPVQLDTLHSRSGYTRDDRVLESVEDLRHLVRPQDLVRGIGSLQLGRSPIDPLQEARQWASGSYQVKHFLTSLQLSSRDNHPRLGGRGFIVRGLTLGDSRMDDESDGD